MLKVKDKKNIYIMVFHNKKKAISWDALDAADLNPKLSVSANIRIDELYLFNLF